MRITMLGTGHGSVTECYNTCFTMDEDKENYFLVDCGGGNQILKQLKDSNIKLEQIKAIFISHTHCDHIVGAIWVIRRLAAKFFKKEIENELLIYGNDLVIKAVRGMCELLLPEVFLPLLDDKIKFIQVEDGDKVTILGKEVTFIDLYAAKVKQFGFYMQLNPDKKFTFLGDEVCTEHSEQYVKNSDWIFADAYMAGEEAEIYNPIQRHHHSTVKYVAELCQRLCVKNVIMSHSSDNDLEHRKEIFVNDAKKYFDGNVFEPYDLERIELD